MITIEAARAIGDGNAKLSRSSNTRVVARPEMCDGSITMGSATGVEWLSRVDADVPLSERCGPVSADGSI
jgi:hypothetical protein